MYFAIFELLTKLLSIMEIAIIIIVVILIAIVYYNNLVRKRNQVENAFSSIDVMLKKRFDLIPNLVEVVKQYTNYEESALTKITELRQTALASGKTENRAEIDREIAASVRGMMIQVENYPDLKANQNYLNLQKTWTESEEQIAAARRAFNSNATVYNNAIMTFPGNLFAGMFSFKHQALLETPAEERVNLNARNLFNS